METASVQQEMLRLAREIEDHNHRYYVLDNPSISDQEYDRLLKRLQELEAANPALRPEDSPTSRVGVKMAAGTGTVRHEVRMLSLDNTYSAQELGAWYERTAKALNRAQVACMVELKVDGVSCSLVYERGRLTLASTRGDGDQGENVTHNVRAMRSVPLRLRGRDIPELLEVRGEVYMHRADVDALNRTRAVAGEEPFANPRNAASGSLKLLDPALSAARRLRFMAHSFGRLKGGKNVSTQRDFLALARDWGFAVSERAVRCATFDEIRGVIEGYQKDRAALPYDVDGAVVKVDAFADQEELGTTMKSPRWAVAYKFEASQATTTVRDIVVQVGRTGVLTPVAELDPVACAGVMISRATLHNFDEVQRLGIAVGDRVLLERAGEVIPRVIRVVERGAGPRKEVRRVPSDCPVCRADFICADEGMVAYRCLNPGCPRQLERRLTHFASRGAMDIAGLGEAVAAQLVGKGLAKSLADIYALSRESLLELEFFGPKKADNLLEAVRMSRGRGLARVLFGFGIPNIGEKASGCLARHFRSLGPLMEAPEEMLMQVPEMGTVSAAAVVRFFGQPETRELIRRLAAAGVVMTSTDPVTAGAYNGKTFVFTGELSRYTRSQASELVKAAGGEVGSGVNRSTDFVVAGGDAGSKLAKARSLGIRVLTETEFEEMLNAS